MLYKIENLHILSKGYLLSKVLNARRVKALETTETYSFVNSFSYFALQENSHKYSLTGLFVDGIFLSVLLNLRYKYKIERASFDYGSIAFDVLTFATTNNFSIGIIGAEEEELNVAIDRIIKRFPTLNISYSRNGYNLDNHIDNISDTLRQQSVDILILGLGAPLQEEYATKFGKIHNLKLIFTCGGFLTQLAESESYYPYLINKYNLRWLYRIVKHRHVRRKFFKYYPHFFIKFLYLWLAGRRSQ